MVLPLYEAMVKSDLCDHMRQEVGCQPVLDVSLGQFHHYNQLPLHLNTHLDM